MDFLQVDVGVPMSMCMYVMYVMYARMCLYVYVRLLRKAEQRGVSQSFCSFPRFMPGLLWFLNGGVGMFM